jgi:hypothetical protein
MKHGEGRVVMIDRRGALPFLKAITRPLQLKPSARDVRLVRMAPLRILYLTATNAVFETIALRR